MVIPLSCNPVKTLTSPTMMMSSRFIHMTNSRWSSKLLSKLKQVPQFGKNLVKVPFRKGCISTHKVPLLFNPIIDYSKPTKKVGIWLFCCSGMIVGSIVLGGITRLTKSGLSMVDWHLFKEFPPLSKNAWVLEFEKYKQFPEFKQNNPDMTLEEFKKIWRMEFAHRWWGRAVGAVFLFPAIYFWSKKYFDRALRMKVLSIGVLLLGQGLLGWYMVKSGLEEKKEPNGVARVSQYRLAAHLGLALGLYTLTFWTALNCMFVPEYIHGFEFTHQLSKLQSFARKTRGLILFTVISGAFVAGIEAGLIYNTWPKMADRWVPSDIFGLKPIWKNFFENASLTQFNHRLLGETVFCAVTGMWWYSRKLNLPWRAQRCMNWMLGLVIMQFCLGILTLLLQVPKPLAAGHQSGAIALFTSAMCLTHELKLLQRMPKF